jgi:hypothetical protein
MAKRMVEIEVDGQPGTRVSVRCKGCKDKWTENITRDAHQAAIYSGAGLLSIVGLGHVCEQMQAWRGRAVWSKVRESFLRCETILWAPRPGGTVTQCGGACRSAKGPNCDCKCKGEHHGAGAARIWSLDDVDVLIAARS